MEVLEVTAWSCHHAAQNLLAAAAVDEAAL
jgi:hypothetical protein